MYLVKRNINIKEGEIKFLQAMFSPEIQYF